MVRRWSVFCVDGEAIVRAAVAHCEASAAKKAARLTAETGRVHRVAEQIIAFDKMMDELVSPTGSGGNKTRAHLPGCE